MRIKRTPGTSIQAGIPGCTPLLELEASWPWAPCRAAIIAWKQPEAAAAREKLPVGWRKTAAGKWCVDLECGVDLDAIPAEKRPAATPQLELRDNVPPHIVAAMVKAGGVK